MSDILVQAGIFLAQEGGDTKSAMSSLILIPIMLVVMYLLVIRPQRAEEKKKKAMLSSLAKGDQVVTSSGIHGKIVEFKDNNELVVLNVGKETNITFNANTVTKKK